jgi:hypothetical protein
MHSSHSQNDVEPRERAGSGNDCPSESNEVVAVGMRDFLDEAKCAQPSELACDGSGVRLSLATRAARRQPWMLNSPYCNVRSSVWSA